MVGSVVRWQNLRKNMWCYHGMHVWRFYVTPSEHRSSYLAKLQKKSSTTVPETPVFIKFELVWASWVVRFEHLSPRSRDAEVIIITFFRASKFQIAGRGCDDNRAHQGMTRIWLICIEIFIWHDLTFWINQSVGKSAVIDPIQLQRFSVTLVWHFLPIGTPQIFCTKLVGNQKCTW